MSYTKKELIEALSSLNDDAIIEIEIINEVKDNGGEESGHIFEIESIALNGKDTAYIVGYGV